MGSTPAGERTILNWDRKQHFEESSLSKPCFWHIIIHYRRTSSLQSFSQSAHQALYCKWSIGIRIKLGPTTTVFSYCCFRWLTSSSFCRQRPTDGIGLFNTCIDQCIGILNKAFTHTSLAWNPTKAKCYPSLTFFLDDRNIKTSLHLNETVVSLLIS